MYGWKCALTVRTCTLYLLYTDLCTGELNAIRKHKCFLCSPFYGKACRWAMLGDLQDLKKNVARGPKIQRSFLNKSELLVLRILMNVFSCAFERAI